MPVNNFGYCAHNQSKALEDPNQHQVLGLGNPAIQFVNIHQPSSPIPEPTQFLYGFYDPESRVFYACSSMEEMLEFQERLTAMQNVMDGPTNSEHLPNEMPSAFSPNNLNLN